MFKLKHIVQGGFWNNHLRKERFSRAAKYFPKFLWVVNSLEDSFSGPTFWMTSGLPCGLYLLVLIWNRFLRIQVYFLFLETIWGVKAVLFLNLGKQAVPLTCLVFLAYLKSVLKIKRIVACRSFRKRLMPQEFARIRKNLSLHCFLHQKQQ